MAKTMDFESSVMAPESPYIRKLLHLGKANDVDAD